MPTPLTQQFRDAKREAILAAGSAAFAEHGFAATTVEAIARRVGVGKATVYDAFGSKEELLLACCLRACEQDDRELLAAGSAQWPGFAAALAALREGREPDLGSLADPLAFSRGVLRAFVHAQLRRAGVDCRLFLDLFMAMAHDRKAMGRVREAIQGMFQGWEALTAAMLRAAAARRQIRRDVDPAAQARLLVVALDGFLLQQFWGRFAEVPAEADRIIDAWFAGLLREG